MLRVGIGADAQRWPATRGTGVGTGTGQGTGGGSGGGTGGGTGSTGPSTLPAVATTRWHPAHSTVVEAGGRVVSASDIMGLADLTEGGAGLGPRILTDAAGKVFWRFEGAQFLDIAAGLATATRDMTVMMVGRVPRVLSAPNRFLSLGSRNAGTQANTLNGPLEARVVSKSAGHLQSFSKLAYTATSDDEWMVPGAQLQVMGAATSGSGTRLFLNERFADVARPFNVTGITGGEIGRYSWSTGTSGNWGQFDLYEMVIFSPGLDNATALAVSQALMADHAVAPVVGQLVLEGDSITQGVAGVEPADSVGAVLGEPGAGWLPAGWRVINKGTSGDDVADLVTKRDVANGWTEQLLPGARNVMAFEIGRNDWSGQTAASHYANVVAYLNTATTGILQRGWEVRIMANIATGSVYTPQTEAFRALIRDPQFLVDCDAGPGQTYDGLVSVISTDLIEDQGQTIFNESSDSANLTYYVGDNTHPTVLGTRLRVTGGDTPQYGVTYGL